MNRNASAETRSRSSLAMLQWFHVSSRMSIIAGLMLAAGCAIDYQPRFGAGGVYHEAGYRSHTAVGVSRSTGHYYADPYARANPIHYPYWSLDFFYFSRFRHPYSVHVGYREPLYHPYPGWVYGTAPHRSRFGANVVFAYPWHGLGHDYPSYGFGFFYSGHDFGHRDRRHHRHRHDAHPIRRIDRRLAAFRDPAAHTLPRDRDAFGAEAARRAAAARDRRLHARGGDRPVTRSVRLRDRRSLGRALDENRLRPHPRHRILNSSRRESMRHGSRHAGDDRAGRLPARRASTPQRARDRRRILTREAISGRRAAAPGRVGDVRRNARPALSTRTPQREFGTRRPSAPVPERRARREARRDPPGAPGERRVRSRAEPDASPTPARSRAAAGRRTPPGRARAAVLDRRGGRR